MAQRYLVQFILSQAGRPDWLSDLAEKLHIDSWNNEYKTFYIESSAGYFGVNAAGTDALLSTFQNVEIELNSLAWQDIAQKICSRNIFDERDGDGPEVLRDQFCCDYEEGREGELKDRLIAIFTNVIHLMNREMNIKHE